MRSLFVAPPDAAVLELSHSHRVTANILRMLLLVEVEDVSSLGLLLRVGGGGGDAAGVVHHIVVESTQILDFLRVSVAHKGFVVGVEFELLCQLLLGHVHPLSVHAPLVASCP